MDLASHWRMLAHDTRTASPLYERLSLAIADDEQVSTILLDAPESQRLGVLLLAAVHYLVLRGADHPLRDFYPSVGGERNGDPFPDFRDFCFVHREQIRDILRTRNTQTNEVGRAAGTILAIGDGRVALVEPGTSAGLNLFLDRFHYDYVGTGSIGDPASTVRLSMTVRGASPQIPARVPSVAFRAGLDLKPVDLNDEDAMLWLRACLWPEQTVRAERFAAARELVRGDPPRVVQGSIATDLPAVCEGAPDDALLCVFHSALLQYLNTDELQAFGESLLRMSKDRPVRWCAFDIPQRMSRVFPGALPEVKGSYGLWRADITDGKIEVQFLARVGYHGEWIEWVA